MKKYTYEFPKNELTSLEDKFLRQRLDSFDCFTDFELKDGNIEVEMSRKLKKRELEMLPPLLDMWLKEETELNIDIDLRDHLPSFITLEEVTEKAKKRLLKYYIHNFVTHGFKKENLEWRFSSGGAGFHIRVKDLKFPPKYVLNMRIPIRDCHHRLRHDRAKFASGLDCAFLYDMKKNIKAEDWIHQSNGTA